MIRHHFIDGSRPPRVPYIPAHIQHPAVLVVAEGPGWRVQLEDRRTGCRFLAPKFCAYRDGRFLGEFWGSAAARHRAQVRGISAVSH